MLQWSLLQAAHAQRARLEADSRSAQPDVANADVVAAVPRDLVAMQESVLGKHTQDEVGLMLRHVFCKQHSV